MRKAISEWLQETHPPGFELLRHFLLRFFDSDLVTEPGQTTAALAGSISIFAPWFPMVIGPLREKYAHFSKLPVPGPYREAVRADELWLITLMMAAIGLLIAIKWQALFPDLRDYRALGSLPLRPRQIFAAKLLALFLVATAAIVTFNLLPSLLFPAVSQSRWAIQPHLGRSIWAHTEACIAGSYFLFFALIALQGLLLNLVPRRLFAKVSGSLQGLLVALMLSLIVLSFSIQATITNALIQPGRARWLPPVWFLGLYQARIGDPDPAMQTLAHWALTGLAAAVALALAAYAISDHRHRTLMVEGAAAQVRERRWHRPLLDWLIPDPREQAILVFITKTLAGSSQHRMILMGYGGFGLALLASGILGMRGLVAPARLAAACCIYAHVILLIFLLVGLRHLFGMPTELKANWTFQITEREGRRQWLRAMDRFVLFWGAVLMLLIPFPVEVMFLGWRAVAESILFIAIGLLCYESLFLSWNKLPFTCSHLPGKTPMWIQALKFFALLATLPASEEVLLACLYSPAGFLAVLTLLLAAWIFVHQARRENERSQRLKYEEVAEPAVHSLNLLKG